MKPLALSFLLALAMAQQQPVATIGGGGQLTPSVTATYSGYGPPNSPWTLQLLVLWRGTPGWSATTSIANYETITPDYFRAALDSYRLASMVHAYYAASGSKLRACCCHGRNVQCEMAPVQFEGRSHGSRRACLNRRRSTR
jgi:hypothetical protein